MLTLCFHIPVLSANIPHFFNSHLSAIFPILFPQTSASCLLTVWHFRCYYTIVLFVVFLLSAIVLRPLRLHRALTRTTFMQLAIYLVAISPLRHRLAAHHLCRYSDLSITHCSASCRCFSAALLMLVPFAVCLSVCLSVGQFAFSFQYFHVAIYQCLNFFAAVIHFFKSNIYTTTIARAHIIRQRNMFSNFHAHEIRAVS